MLTSDSIRGGKVAATFCCGIAFLFFLVSNAEAQSATISTIGPITTGISSYGGAEPPLDVPLNKLPARDPNAIAIDGWLLYPTLRIYSLYSDNLFFSPVDQLSLGGVGITPGLVAEWTNGIHTTTFYGNIDRQAYPTDNDVNTLDGRAGFTQRYEAMRDLIFTFNSDFNHKTWAAGLQNSIQAPAATPSTTALSNGNTILPNGTIISPSGQTVGQVATTGAGNIPLSVNPFDQYTDTLTATKIFNRGILSFSGSLSRTDYEQDSSLSTRSKTFTEAAGFWLGPLLYAYSTGNISTVVTDATSVATTSYRVVAGLGMPQFGLFRGSLYYGQQGSEGGTTAGGDVYGGTLSYYPTPVWTITAAVDRTINILTQTSAPSDLALTLPGLTGVQVSLDSSTAITSTSLLSNYQISSLWFTILQVGYTSIDYVDSTRRDHTWVVDEQLRYDLSRNLSLTWEYNYRSISSNLPASSLVNATSNTVTMGANYRF
jgi:hypothetical protein